MSASLRTRLAVYVIALGLAVAAFVVIGFTTASMRAFWIGRIERWEVESTDSAAECKAALRDLHFKLLRYELSRAPQDRIEFTRGEEALSEWIEQRSAQVTVPETRQILREIGTAFAGYRERAHALLDRPANGGDRSARQMLDRLEVDAERLMQLDARLGMAQRESLGALMARARRDVNWVWRIFYVCLATLLVCGAVLARMVFRDMIAPLRHSVARSRVLLERQEKLGALGLLLAGLAHEIRNPLNSIKARLATQRRLLGLHSPGLEDNEFIEDEIDRLDAVMEDALQFARPAPPSFQRLRLRPVLESLCELAGPALTRSNIELRTEYLSDPELALDAVQFKQALLNLVKNAAESVGRDGVVTLRTRAAALPGRSRRVPAVAIEVQDSGRGVPREAQRRLFDPFFTTKEDGTGLGLSITARIVHAHGGWLECDPAVTRGALFRIVLPLEISK